MRKSVAAVSLGLALCAPSAGLERVQETTSAHEYGAVEVVLFFTTECAPCREVIPVWNDLVRESDTEGLEVSFRAVSGELADDIRLYLEGQPIAGEVVSDPAVDLARAYGLQKLPSVVVVRPGQGTEILTPERLTLARLRAIVGEVMTTQSSRRQDPVGYDH